MQDFTTLDFDSDAYPHIELLVPDAIVVQPRYNPPYQEDSVLDDCLGDALILMVNLKKSVTLKRDGYSYYLHYPGVIQMIKDRCSARSH